MPETLVCMDHVTKIFRDNARRQVVAVNDLSLTIYEGETLGLVGESGCGKSTAGNLLVHLLRADAGSIIYKGTDVTKLSERAFRPYRREIQMIFQDPYGSINPQKTIGWLLEEPFVIQKSGLSKKERRARAEEMLTLVGLDASYADRYPRELSGGQRQRVSIALALMMQPAFIVADEPVSALDVSVQAQILNLLAKLKKELSLTMLFVSHDLNVVSYLADRIGVMYLGSLVEIGTEEQIHAGARHPYTQALFAAALEEAGSDEKQIVLKGDLPSPSDPPKGCAFHTRCPYAKEICTCEKPQLREMESGWQVACHFPLDPYGQTPKRKRINREAVCDSPRRDRRQPHASAAGTDRYPALRDRTDAGQSLRTVLSGAGHPL